MMGAAMPERPKMPDLDLLRLRQTLIREEYVEVNEVIEMLASGESDDMARLIHELCDLLYVAYGAILACGVDPDPVFDEVHQANMRKLDGPRRADGKILKPKGWQPADVEKIIQGMKNSPDEET